MSLSFSFLPFPYVLRFSALDAKIQSAKREASQPEPGSLLLAIDHAKRPNKSTKVSVDSRLRREEDALENCSPRSPTLELKKDPLSPLSAYIAENPPEILPLNPGTFGPSSFQLLIFCLKELSG